MQNRLGSGHRDDQVGLDERRVHAERDVALLPELDEIFGLRVVHDHAALEAPPEVGRHERPDLTRRGAAHQAARDEDGRPADAEALELLCDRRDRGVARADLNSGDGKRRLLDHDRRRAAALHERFERRTGERKLQRVAHRLADILQRLARKRRTQHQIVCAGLGDDDPRVIEQWDARHVLRRATAAVMPSATKTPPVNQRRTFAPVPVRRIRPAIASETSA